MAKPPQRVLQHTNSSNNFTILKMKRFDSSFKIRSNRNSTVNPISILAAARDGDALRLKRLLNQKTVSYNTNSANSGQNRPIAVYPEDYEYHYQDLLHKDEEGRTALHLAAAVANEEMSLETIKVLLESVQVSVEETLEDGKTIDGYRKLTRLVNCRDAKREIAIIRAIENRSDHVVFFLMANNSDVLAKDVNGIEVLKLVYQKVPDALKENYDDSIQLAEDHKGLSINWGAVIGFRQFTGENVRSWKETEYLKYALTPDKGSAQLLLHPLLKLFLYLKWSKIKWFFCASFLFHLIWLGLYAAAFVLLQESVNLKDSNQTVDSSITKGNAGDSFGGHILWKLLLAVTIIMALKEVYQLCVLRLAYWTMENLTQISFIILYVIQFSFLMAGDLKTGATISIIGVFLMTVLTIMQFGKIPYFGVQVAAVKKVIYTCTPHFPLLIVWFIGFGLIFWALFYKHEDSSALGIPARVAAMGTGDLNASEMLDKFLSGSATLRDFVCVLCFIFFIVFVVTLHFNLLIGYAVSDIQVLNKKAEALELYNRLSTIYTVESFIVSLGSCFCRHGTLNSVYVLPPETFRKQNGVADLKFNEIPTNILKECQEIGFKNLKKRHSHCL